MHKVYCLKKLSLESKIPAFILPGFFLNINLTYFPEKFPRLTPDEIAAFANLPYHEIAFRVLSRFTDGVISNDALATMCRDAYNFNIPLEKTYDRVHVMRLDQGPTASFKDFAAQMMARLFGHFLRETGQQLTILTATSGDTGAAVAHAFHNIPSVRVIVLFPFDEVTGWVTDPLHAVGIADYSLWWIDVPEFLRTPYELYVRLGGQEVATGLAYQDIEPQFIQIFNQHRTTHGVVLRQQRLLWQAYLTK